MQKEKKMFVAVDTEDLIQRVVVMAGLIWREYYPGIIGEGQVDYMLAKFQSFESIQEQIDGGLEYYLVNRGGADVGYFAVQVEGDALFLSKLYVKESKSGEGVGSRVLKFIQNHWKPGAVRLTVNKKNAASIRFYENRGFNNTGEVVQGIGGDFVMDDYKMEWCC